MTATTIALIDAIRRKSEDSVKELLEKANPNIMVNFGEQFHSINATPLHIAIQNEDCEKIIISLLEKGAKPGYEVLVMALNKYDASIIKELLESGVDATHPPPFTESALHHVARLHSTKDRRKVCKLLLKHGVQVDHLNEYHYTPLFYATEANIIDTLLDHGAQPCHEHRHGSPLQRSFMFPEAIVKNMVKYASLQVRHTNDIELNTSLLNFTRNKDTVQKPMYAKYVDFARKCMSEIETLKQLELTEDCPTLFDFAMSHDPNSSFRSDSDVLRRVFDLPSSRLPIYSEIIMKKIDRNVVLSKVLHCYELLKFNSMHHDNIQILDFYSMMDMTKYLSKTDLGNIFTAIYVV